MMDIVVCRRDLIEKLARQTPGFMYLCAPVFGGECPQKIKRRRRSNFRPIIAGNRTESRRGRFYRNILHYVKGKLRQ